MTCYNRHVMRWLIDEMMGIAGQANTVNEATWQDRRRVELLLDECVTLGLFDSLTVQLTARLSKPTAATKPPVMEQHLGEDHGEEEYANNVFTPDMMAGGPSKE